eukprot:3339006-Ditylum_brightwellii.AAC.1
MYNSNMKRFRIACFVLVEEEVVRMGWMKIGTVVFLDGILYNNNNNNNNNNKISAVGMVKLTSFKNKITTRKKKKVMIQ